MKIKILGFFLLASAALNAGSPVPPPVTFVFDDGSSTGAAGLALEALTEGTDAANMGLTTSGTYTQGGIELSAGSDFGKFNLTNTSFGIDNPGSETGGFDDTDRFDNDSVDESMVFSFNTAGIFQIIDLVAIDQSDEAFLIFEGGPTYEISTDTDLAGDTFNIGQAFTAGQKITLTVSSTATAETANFGLESFTVVPEPNTYALLSGICALGFVMLRRRNQ